jgi:ABC-type antimicrobial peptide transport system ATPase subunit
MLSKWQFRLLTSLGAAALLLVIGNMLLSTLNRNTQIALNQKQAFIQQTVPLEGLYRDIVKALAEMAVKGNDRQVLDMLSAQGLSVSVNNPTAASSEPSLQKSEKQK